MTTAQGRLYMRAFSLSELLTLGVHVDIRDMAADEAIAIRKIRLECDRHRDQMQRKSNG